MTYSEKRRDPRWQKKRLEILNRDKFTCLICGADDKPLNVHHHYYISGRDPWDYPNWSLATLCEPCHETAQQQAKTEFDSFEWLLEMLSLGDADTVATLYLLVDDLRCAGNTRPGVAVLATLRQAIKNARKKTKKGVAA